jgi:hypothetical protein
MEPINLFLYPEEHSTISYQVASYLISPAFIFTFSSGLRLRFSACFFASVFPNKILYAFNICSMRIIYLDNLICRMWYRSKKIQSK